MEWKTESELFESYLDIVRQIVTSTNKSLEDTAHTIILDRFKFLMEKETELTPEFKEKLIEDFSKVDFRGRIEIIVKVTKPILSPDNNED